MFSLERNKWAALLWSCLLNRKCGSVLLLLSLPLSFFSLSLFLFCIGFFIYFFIVLFYFWQGVNWSDSPTLLDSASGHKWAAGFLGALLIQLGAFQNHPVPSGKMKLSSVRGQLSIRAEELLPLALFPFSLCSFLLLKKVFKDSETLMQHLLALDLKSIKETSYVCVFGLNLFLQGKTVINFLLVISPAQILWWSPETFCSWILMI